MSHAATNWAIQQRGLKPITKLLLWHLADRHNPDHGCFPEQSTLATDCEISRATVNRHLDNLEKRGLIRREPRIDPETNRQKSTRYHLGCEPSFTPLDVVTRVSNRDTAFRVSKTTKAVSQSCETLTCKLTSKSPLPPASETKPTLDVERVSEFNNPELWNKLIEISGKSPPTSDGTWCFAKDLVEAAKRKLEKPDG